MSVPTMVNGRWPLYMPEHHAARDNWAWWEATRLAAMNAVVGVGSVVYDIGAEEGDFPALWASWGAEVVLAEPDTRVWPNIKELFAKNELPDPLFCWDGFVGAEATAEVGAHPGNHWTAPPAWPASAEGDVIDDHGFCRIEERPDIAVTTIDKIAQVTKAPTCITIDVEGAEHLVIEGATDTLTVWRPDVFISIHPEFMRHHYGIEDGRALIKKMMDDLGYDETFLCIDHEHHVWYRAR